MVNFKHTHLTKRMLSWRGESRRTLAMHGIRGFTLVELVLVIVLAGILFGMGGVMLNNMFRSFFSERDISRADWQARVALERMTRELREVRSTVAADFSIATLNEIYFTDVSGNAVCYYRSAANVLIRGNAMAACNTSTIQPLADDVTTLSFQYLQNDGVTVTATAAQVYYITVVLSIVNNTATQTVRATVHPRNF